MLAPPLLVASFLFVGLLLFGLAFLLSRQVPPSPELRFAAVVTGVMGVVSLAFAVLVWREILGARRPRPPQCSAREVHVQCLGVLTRDSTSCFLVILPVKCYRFLSSVSPA
jgi:hypothetical protein